MPKEIIEEKYRIITKYLTLLVSEKDFISKDDIKLILEVLDKDSLISGEV